MLFLAKVIKVDKGSARNDLLLNLSGKRIEIVEYCEAYVKSILFVFAVVKLKFGLVDTESTKRQGHCLVDCNIYSSNRKAGIVTYHYES